MMDTDGGASRLSSLPSAYATGEVLYPLTESGMAAGYRFESKGGLRGQYQR
jgi:hypothetical protein